MGSKPRNSHAHLPRCAPGSAADHPANPSRPVGMHLGRASRGRPRALLTLTQPRESESFRNLLAASAPPTNSLPLPETLQTDTSGLCLADRKEGSHHSRLIVCPSTGLQAPAGSQPLLSRVPGIGLQTWDQSNCPDALDERNGFSFCFCWFFSFFFFSFCGPSFTLLRPRHISRCQ